MAPKKKHPGGRPTKFSEKAQDIIALLSRKGFTDVEMSEVLGITERTLNNWKNKHTEFFQSLRNWKKSADSKVERSLYERACGYTHPETKSQYVVGEGWKILDMVKHYPPDPTSMIFWLKNRQPEVWSDKVDVNQTTTLVISEADRSAAQEIAKELAKREMLRVKK